MEKNNKNNIQIETKKNDLKPESNTGLVSIDIKNIFRILKKRKWWFIATFIIIFCAVFSFTYFVTPESKYSIQSTVLISTDNIKYQEKINYYFPKEAYDLWLIANEAYPLNSLNYYYMDAVSYINSDKVIDSAYQKLGNLFSKDILRKSIVTGKSIDGTQLNISISYKNKSDTKKIADAILGSFVENKKSDFEASYDSLLKKTDNKINNLNSEVSSLMNQADNYSLEFNKKIVNELKTINNNQINFYVSDYIPPDIKVKLDADNDQLTNLKDIKNNLEEYKNLYINRIVLNTNNEVIANINILKNLILSLAAGIIFGLIFAFAANYFKSN
ncbi:MAG: Wzz/FepE/Etk N-terminal domain-containing protein [Actinobacteria bacterium]|nr:Wzz/FepE/Etk N-terminal domain-containing protein [Actinomycetota bacterium]